MKFFSKSSSSKIIVLLMLILFSFTSIAYGSTQFDYVALGDSLAAGYTPTGTIDKSYTDFITDKLNGERVLGDYNNFGVPGYTTTNVLATINPMDPANIQRVAAISEAEIITLDIGANDLLDLIPVLLTNPSQAQPAIEGVVTNIAQIISTLKFLNPEAKIYLMGYYNAFPFLPEEQQAYIIPLITEFNKGLEGIAKLTGATYVDTYKAMDKHLTKYLPEENIHPNISGYRALAKEFWNIIKVDFLRGLN